MPLLTFDGHPSDFAPHPAFASSPRPTLDPASNSATKPPRKGWLTYAPLVVLFAIILIPQPSFILALTSFYLRSKPGSLVQSHPQTQSQPASEPHSRPWPFPFFIHVLVVELLTLAAVGAVVVCVVRDAGQVGGRNKGASESGNTGERNGRRNKKIKKSTGVTPVQDADDTAEGVTTSLLRSGRASYESGDGEQGEDGEWALARDGYEYGLGGGDDHAGVEHDDAFEGDWAGDENGNGYDVETQLEGDSSDQAQGIQARDLNTPTNTWCAKCNIRRPERAHHCGACGWCVVKMDHHCPWLGGCIGHRTYPAFFHFLLTSTLLAAYITAVAFVIIVHYVREPGDIDPRTSPLHALFLLLMGAVFTLTMGAFLGYHVFLVSTNQTTLEHMSPFLLLRYIPPPPSPPPPQPQSQPQLYDDATPAYTPYGVPLPQADDADEDEAPLALALQVIRSKSTPSSHTAAHLPHTNTAHLSHTSSTHPRRPTFHPPSEHDLSSAQRRVVQHAHGRVRPYDLGFRRNWREMFGGGWRSICAPARKGKAGEITWLRHLCFVGLLLLCGGRPQGDGWTFERGREGKEGVERLVRELEDVRRAEGRGWVWAAGGGVRELSQAVE